MTSQLTHRPEAVYAAYVEYMVANNGRCPSTRDIMEMTGITSTSVANYHRNKLLEEGKLIEMAAGNGTSARRIGLVSAVYAVPRNVAEGNLSDITETSVFVDGDLELSYEISDYLIIKVIRFTGSLSFNTLP